MTRRPDGTSALVTGASSDIGEATALALAAEGATVALAARRRDRLEELARRIEAGGGRALVLEVDVTRKRRRGTRSSAPSPSSVGWTPWSTTPASCCSDPSSTLPSRSGSGWSSSTSSA